MANPSGNHQDSPLPNHGGGGGGSSSFNANSVPAAAEAEDNSAVTAGPVLHHNPGISTDWTSEEQAILEEGLTRYASESSITRYAKIAVQLQNKTVRDVALRCRWMTKKEYSKKRKDDHKPMRKSYDRKEKVPDISANSPHLASLPVFSPFGQMTLTDGTDDDISYSAIGGVVGQLLEQNAQAFKQISANFTTRQIHENASLLYQARDNIFQILNHMNTEPDTMKRMPPLPVKVNEELANTFLPPATLHPMQL